MFPARVHATFARSDKALRNVKAACVCWDSMIWRGGVEEDRAGTLRIAGQGGRANYSSPRCLSRYLSAAALSMPRNWTQPLRRRPTSLASREVTPPSEAPLADRLPPALEI